jgi:hypothetical protein
LIGLISIAVAALGTILEAAGVQFGFSFGGGCFYGHGVGIDH